MKQRLFVVFFLCLLWGGLTLSSAGWVDPLPPTSLETRYYAVGPVELVQELVRDVTWWSGLLERIARGDQDGLKTVPLLLAGAEGKPRWKLIRALARALPENSSRVLALGDFVISLKHVCAVPFDDEGEAFRREYLARTVAAPEPVGESGLQTEKRICLLRLRRAKQRVASHRITSEAVRGKFYASGPKALIHDLVPGGDPKRQGAMGGWKDWRYASEQIVAGDGRWIAVVPYLYADAGGVPQDWLEQSVAEALPKKPRAVLRLEDRISLSNVCTMPFVGGNDADLRRYASRTIAALRAVNDPELRDARKMCLFMKTWCISLK